MRRSQLEMHMKIMEILDHLGPLKLMNVKNRTNVNCSLLKESFDFLTKHGLVE